ncbi:hypothetical protein K1T71_001533 [Dendrolimus kikuchii]|uniref:Uncharacterized protein n=1 Tax=Dendrolimus kikuchii TaxID=765133 RepID=A0ACC1DI33_9NEOP|nr:hypothetical protein K1T71_001533 [Dendrolimus kikuchii]
MSTGDDAEAVRDGGSSDLASSLLKEVGHFSKYQFRTMALCCLSVIIIGMAISEYLFTIARINTRCLIPECESESTPAEYAPDWILTAVPGDSVDSFDNCQRYAPRNYTWNETVCSADLFDSSIIQDCDQHVYENQLTVVYDFDLGCDEWRRTMSGFLRTCGMLVGMPLTGYISDRWGRRTAMGFNAFNAFWIGLSRYWASNYIWFVAVQVVESMLACGLFTSAYILVMELVGPKYRTISGAILLTAWAVSQMTLGLVAWVFKHWRVLTLAIYIPQIITLVYLWAISESIRWYITKGRFTKAEEVLIKAAKVNGKTLSDKSREALRLAGEKFRRGSTGNTEKEDDSWLIVQVFKNKPMLLRCIVSPICWMSTNLVYYGLSINAVNMAGNSYLNYVAVSAADIPGFWLSVFLMQKTGRKTVLIGGFWVCAACMVAFIFVPSHMYGLSLTVYLLGKSSISLVLIANYVFTAELYPTKYRHNLFAFSSTIGRLGNIAAPLIPAIEAATFEDLPIILFGGFALLSGLLIFMIPETRGTKLPDTMEEACAIGTKQNKI